MYETDYSLLLSQLRSLSEGISRPVTVLSNASALLAEALPCINWAGFYLRDGEILYLGPFQGKPACMEIPLGRGVCGTAARTGCTQRVEDVHAFPGHIACDSASRSELVIPIRLQGAVWGVLDIDSPVTGRFSPEDRKNLEAFVNILEEILSAC